LDSTGRNTRKANISKPNVKPNMPGVEFGREEQLYVLLDTASRPGMSGSPVIRRSWAAHLYENQGGSVLGKAIQTRFVGVYSGRIGASGIEAQLGIMWPETFVTEIVSGGVRDQP
jgi:hypothetical protein